MIPGRGFQAQTLRIRHGELPSSLEDAAQPKAEGPQRLEAAFGKLESGHPHTLADPWHVNQQLRALHPA